MSPAVRSAGLTVGTGGFRPWRLGGRRPGHGRQRRRRDRGRRRRRTSTSSKYTVGSGRVSATAWRPTGAHGRDGILGRSGTRAGSKGPWVHAPLYRPGRQRDLVGLGRRRSPPSLRWGAHGQQLTYEDSQRGRRAGGGHLRRGRAHRGAAGSVRLEPRRPEPGEEIVRETLSEDMANLTRWETRRQGRVAAPYGQTPGHRRPPAHHELEAHHPGGGGPDLGGPGPGRGTLDGSSSAAARAAPQTPGGDRRTWYAAPWPRPPRWTLTPGR